MKKMWISEKNLCGKRFKSVDNIIDNSEDFKPLYELKKYRIPENSSFYINYLQVRGKIGKEIIVDISKFNHKNRVDYIKYSCALPYHQWGELFSIKEVKEYLQQVKNSAVVATFTTNTTTEMAEIIYSGEYQNNIRLIGFGEITDKVKNYIDEGIIDMFLAQDNQNIGYKIIYAVNSLCQGKESHEKNWNVDLLSYDESKEN